MPVDSPTPLSRRRFVAVTAGLVGLLAAGACAVPEPDREDDPLHRLAHSAARDARELAAADASHGDDAARLRRVGEVRRVHAERLGAEVDRQAAGPTVAVDELIGSEPTPTTAVADDRGGTVVCPPIDEVRARLRDDATAAAEVAAESEGYRAELAAAVSAACTAALEVVLA